jgi:hypothetical protein
MGRLLACFLVLFLVPLAKAQTPPLALGSVSSVASASCPGSVGFLGGDTCLTANVSCTGVPNLGVTYSYQNPSGKVKGTVVYFAAGQGTTMSGEVIDTFQPTLVAAGWQVVKFIWASSWWNAATTPNLLMSACLPATLGNYFHTSVYTSGLFNALGNSAGSSAIGYWLAWYGGASLLHFVELMNGPVFSDISQGCQFPKAPNVTVIPTYGSPWSATVYYQGGDPSSLSTATGITCLNASGTTGTQNAAWLAQSITASGWISSYPNVTIASWVCNSNLNNSEGQAWIFFRAMTSPYRLTAVSGCTGPEDIADGTTPAGINGATAVLNDMLQDP